MRHPLTYAVSLTGMGPTAVTYLLPEELTTGLLWYFRRLREQSLPVRAVEKVIGHYRFICAVNPSDIVAANYLKNF